MSPLLLGHVVEMKGETGIKGMPGYKKGQVVGTRRGKDGQPIMFTDDPLVERRHLEPPPGIHQGGFPCPWAGTVPAHALPRLLLPVVFPEAVQR